MLPCPSVFTTFHSKAFQDRPPPCFSCSLSPQFHWVDPLTELSHTELALIIHWHKITELICSSPGQKGVSHLTVPFLLPLNLAYADPSASAHVTPWQITSALEDWSFTRIWSWLCLLGRSSVSLPPSSNPFIWYLQYSDSKSCGPVACCALSIQCRTLFWIDLID